MLVTKQLNLIVVGVTVSREMSCKFIRLRDTYHDNH